MLSGIPFPRKPNKQFVLYFLSFFLVILLPVIFLSLSSYRLVYSTVLDEIREGTTNSLRQTGASVDRLLTDITTLSLQLGLDGNIYVSSTNVDDAFLLNEVRDRISVLSNENGYVQGIQIYMRKNNLILSSEAPNRYYKDEIYDRWINVFSASGKDQLWLPTRSFVDQDGNGYRIVTLVRKLPVAFPSNTGYIAVHVYEDRLNEVLKSMGTDRNSSIYLTDSSGVVLSSFPPPADTKVALTDAQMSALLAAKNDDSRVSRVGGVESLVTFSAPLKNGWELVSIDSLDDLEKKLEYNRRVILLIGLLLISLGAVISYYLSRTMYNPIKRLFEKTKDLQKELELPLSPNNGNSLVMVSGVVDQFIHLHRELEAAYKDGHSAIVDRFLYQLFYNRTGTNMDLEQKLDDMRLSITPFGFVVMIAEIDDYASLRERFSVNDLNLWRYATQNIVQEVVSAKYACICTEMADNQIAVLVNLESVAEHDRVYLAEMAGEIVQAVRFHLKFSVTVGFGDPVEPLSHAHVSFQQATDVIRRKMLMDDRKVLFHEAEGHVQIFQYFYPVHLEKALINNLRACNEHQTRECLNQLKAELKSSPNLSHENVFRLYNRLIDSMIDLAVEAGLSWENVYGTDNVYRELAKQETIEGIHQWMERLCLRMIEQLRNHYRSPSKVDTAISFIADNFHHDISVEHIADAVQLNQAYLSRIFKQSTGKTVLEHLTLVRLEQSKILLSDTTLNLQEITQRIGYNNTNSFIRFFRKYEGVTPGEYRKLQGQAVNNAKSGRQEI